MPSDHNLIFQGIDSQNIKNIAAADSQTSSLADGIMDDSSVLAENIAFAVNNVSGGAFMLWPETVNQFSIFSVLNKTNILTVGFL